MESTVTRAGAIPLDNAAHAHLRFEHGAGLLIVRAATDPDLLLTGDFGEHAEMDVRRVGEELDVVVRPVFREWSDWMNPTYWWGPRRPFDWDIQISPTIPLILEFASGASKSILDLARLHATKVILNTGMSDTELTLPAAAGFSSVEVHSGLANVTICVPSGVAASIHGKVGLGALTVDETRFRPVAEGFESPGFATATNRVEILLEGGLEAISVL